MDIMKQLGVNIKKARIKRGLTQEELSVAVGHKSAAWLSFVEKGQRNISVKDLYGIAGCLNTTMVEILNQDFPSRSPEKELFIKTMDGKPVARFTVKF